MTVLKLSSRTEPEHTRLLTPVSETATILLLKTWMLLEPLVAKFHPIGFKQEQEVSRQVHDEVHFGRDAPYLPELQITNNPVGDLAESPAMRAVGLLVGVPPLRPSVNSQSEIADGTLKCSPLGREHQPNPSSDRWSRARLR